MANALGAGVESKGLNEPDRPPETRHIFSHIYEYTKGVSEGYSI